MILLNYELSETTVISRLDYSIEMTQYELCNIDETQLNQIKYMKEIYLGVCKDNLIRLILNNESEGYLFCIGQVDDIYVLAYYIVTGDIASGVKEVIESWK